MPFCVLNFVATVFFHMHFPTSSTDQVNSNYYHDWRWSIIRRLGGGYDKYLGAVSIRKMVLPGMAIPMLKIRRPNGRLIFNMEITIRR